MANYNSYIELSPHYESVVDIDSENRNPNMWQEYIVHEDMKDALDKICQSLSFEDMDKRRSFWVHGAYPSFREIGERIGMSKNTVMKYLRSLEKRGLVETEQTLIRTKSGEVHNGTLKYHITPIAPIKKAYDEKELDKLRREAEMRERIAKYERHTKNSVHAENHAENGQM